MSEKFHVPDGDIRSRKCCLCNHLLSVAPIMVTGLEQELYKCGRCEKVNCQTYTRNRLFESIALHLSFPCSYEQCDKKLSWGLVEKHEKNCRYRTMKCPIYYHNCSDMVPVDKLQSHFEDKHKKNVKKAGDFWDVNATLDYVFLIEVDGQHFLVYILHLDEIFSIAVLSINRSKYTKFNLKMLPSAGDQNFAVTFEDFPVVRYDERSHCYMCIRRKCEEPHHPFSKKNSGEERLDSGGFASKLKKEFIDNIKSPNGELRYQIKLIADDTITIAEPSELVRATREHRIEQDAAEGGADPQFRNNVDSIRSFLSCPYCMTYMAAPIFICTTGHTICNVCRPRYLKCPTCAESLGESRNYTLEMMAEEMEIPCLYEGCTFIGTSKKMYFHEQECAFSNLLKE